MYHFCIKLLHLAHSKKNSSFDSDNFTKLTKTSKFSNSQWDSYSLYLTKMLLHSTGDWVYERTTLNALNKQNLKIGEL